MDEMDYMDKMDKRYWMMRKRMRKVPAYAGMTGCADGSS